jgi:hypothetical protein
MRTEFRLLLLSVIVLCSASFAQAQCFDYSDPGPGTCSGAGGCEGTYPRTLCFGGCISGTCNPDGNIANCCGTPHTYAQAYPDGQNNCTGWCGLISVHLARRHTRRPGKIQNVSHRKHDPDVALLAYRPQRILFVPNTCTHVYEAFLEGYVLAPSKGGM